MLKIGDKIVVQGIMPPATIEKIWYDEKSARQVIELDWEANGKSKVYGHDENQIWYKYSGKN